MGVSALMQVDRLLGEPVLPRRLAALGLLGQLGAALVLGEETGDAV